MAVTWGGAAGERVTGFVRLVERALTGLLVRVED
jgi:hypothetical protein